MASKKLIAATLLTAMAISGAAEARRRSVRHPALDATYIAPTTGRLVVTNYDSVPATVKACAQTCLPEDTLNPGVTKEYIIETLGEGESTFLKSSTGKLDARTARLRMERVSDFTMQAQAVPVVDVAQYAQDLLILSRTEGVVDVARLDAGGVQSDLQSYTIMPGVTRIKSPHGEAAAYTQLRITATVPVSTLLEVTGQDGRKAYLKGQALDKAGSNQFVLGTQNARYMVKNPVEDGWLIANGYLLLMGEDNVNANNPRNVAVINGGIGNGTVGATVPSSFQIEGTYNPTTQKSAPLIAWAMENGNALPFVEATSGAVGRSAMPGDSTERRQIAFNQQGKLLLQNTSPSRGTVKGKILGYNADGTLVASQDYSLRTLEGQSYDINNIRTLVTVDDLTDNAMVPRVIGTLQNGNDTFTGYQMAKPAEKVTGEQYVARWLDPLKEQYFFLSNDEVRSMINGSTRTRSYAEDLAEILGPATGNSAHLYEQLLREWTDNTNANGELYRDIDPMNVNMRDPYGIRFYYEPSGGHGDTVVSSDAMTDVFTVLRRYLIDRVTAYPEHYGGSQQTGPDLMFDPTFTTQDKN